MASLTAGQYYAHPRNLFWDLMGELFGAGRDLPYGERCARLIAAGVAVWDVLHAAERPGSLDSDIDLNTMEVNDFRAFLQVNPTIRTVAFNGGTAARLFRRRALPGLADPVAERSLAMIALPSTSPAHAGRTREQKLALWRALLAT